MRIDPREYETNWKFQKMFERGELPESPLFEVKFLDTSRMRTCAKQKFFFYEGKWRNTESKSVWGSKTFDEDEIRPTIYY